MHIKILKALTLNMIPFLILICFSCIAYATQQLRELTYKH